MTLKNAASLGIHNVNTRVATWVFVTVVVPLAGFISAVCAIVLGCVALFIWALAIRGR